MAWARRFMAAVSSSSSIAVAPPAVLSQILTATLFNMSMVSTLSDTERTPVVFTPRHYPNSPAMVLEPWSITSPLAAPLAGLRRARAPATHPWHPAVPRRSWTVPGHREPLRVGIECVDRIVAVLGLDLQPFLGQRLHGLREQLLGVHPFGLGDL